LSYSTPTTELTYKKLSMYYTIPWFRDGGLVQRRFILVMTITGICPLEARCCDNYQCFLRFSNDDCWHLPAGSAVLWRLPVFSKVQ